MRFKDRIKARGAGLLEAIDQPFRRQRDLMVVLGELLRLSPLADFHDPVAYIELLRDGIERLRVQVREVKRDRAGNSGLPDRRFSLLLETLGTEVPPLDTRLLDKVARIVDQYRACRTELDDETWPGDVSLACQVSSTRGHKGRILAAVTRLMRTSAALELGTAFGISTMIIFETLRSTNAKGRLITVDCSRQTQEIAARMLKSEYGDAVECRLGRTQEILPHIRSELGTIDLVFHDAGHSYEDFTQDFGAVESSLPSGAVILIDDIRWQDERFYKGSPRTHEGFLALVSHPRVARAAEVDRDLGLLLLR